MFHSDVCSVMYIKIVCTHTFVHTHNIVARWPHSFQQDNTLHTAYNSYIILCTCFIMCCIFDGDSMLIRRGHGVSTAVKHDCR